MAGHAYAWLALLLLIVCTLYTLKGSRVEGGRMVRLYRGGTSAHYVCMKG